MTMWPSVSGESEHREVSHMARSTFAGDRWHCGRRRHRGARLSAVSGSRRCGRPRLRLSSSQRGAEPLVLPGALRTEVFEGCDESGDGTDQAEPRSEHEPDVCDVSARDTPVRQHTE